MLEALGLDSVCEMVYGAAIAKPQVEREELRESLGLSETELDQALAKLSDLALVRPLLDRPHSFRAVDPEVGIRAVIAREQARLATEQQRIEQVRLAAAQLAADFTVARPNRKLPGVERLDGIDVIRERISLLVRDVHTEVMTFAPGGAQSEASMQAAKPQDQALLERGVRMRTLYLDSVRNSPETVAYANWLAGLNGEVRTVPSLPVRLMIFDRSIAIVPTDEENSRAGALVISASGPLSALCALFDTVWESAAPLTPVLPRDRENGSGLSRQESEALHLLGQGFTDVAVAKRLGVSPRTARRIAADLMEKLQSRSRFQAGVRAAARGWLNAEQ